MVLPTIHLNGTAQHVLLEQVVDAADSLRTAIEKLTDAEPNGRDYPQRSAVFGIAQNEHRHRLEKLQDVLEELSTLAEQISDL